MTDEPMSRAILADPVAVGWMHLLYHLRLIEKPPHQIGGPPATRGNCRFCRLLTAEWRARRRFRGEG